MNSNSFIRDKENILNLFKEKKFTKVIKLGKNLLKKKPKDFDLLYILGFSSINLQNYIDAEKFFKKILIYKQNADIFYIYGKINSNLKNYDKALESFNKAISLNPKFSEAYNNLGNLEKLNNKIEDAVKNYKKAISTKKDNLIAYFNLALILKENKKYLESKDTYEKLLKIDKDNLGAKHDLGTIYSILGNFKRARKYFQEVLEKDEKNFKSYKNYIEITKISEKDLIFNKLQNTSTDSISDQNKIDMFFSLSKGYFDQENIKAGFEYLEKAKNIKKKITNFSIKKERNIFKNLQFYFDKNYSKEINHNLNIKNIPIFIVGMPRSGTTLIEQILSAHSKIHGAGELIHLPKIIDHIYLNNNKTFSHIINDIRHEYSQELVKISNKNYIIDKLPLNFKWIGFIIKAFPEAKIIHLERNPMAVCWSNYKINFRDSGMDFTLSQKDISEYYVLYNELMHYWSTKFNEKIININYEKFVLNYELESKNLINQLNLTWEEELKSYNIDNNRPVETASLFQVRGKIIKNTSEHWKKYKDYLCEMRNILENNKIDF